MGRPKLYDSKIWLRVDAAWLARLDRWRAEQPDRPDRATAVRRLVDHVTLQASATAQSIEQ